MKLLFTILLLSVLLSATTSWLIDRTPPRKFDGPTRLQRRGMSSYSFGPATPPPGMAGEPNVPFGTMDISVNF
ncbi:unnamed protein product [Bursaphelenchus okinawaensis]|uniref:Uncharacterized protein n=1 Tax=Bursaphelenchus okinawaensis TaxID=465554 RepID=A0A811LSN6_9BILA|nr:unnamed protein product [Bursaphelenchus okinawaensis]CAG9127491.1 unnamed protein product [Bursaphelenchus okinawaensis]